MFNKHLPTVAMILTNAVSTAAVATIIVYVPDGQRSLDVSEGRVTSHQASSICFLDHVEIEICIP